jgi:hypothetical protein
MDLHHHAFWPNKQPHNFYQLYPDVNSQWKALAQKSDVVIDDDTNTKIIVDNIFNWAKLLEAVLLYIKYQLCVCQSY